jgi:hypothetical protein
VANRSPTPASKINDFLELFDDIWEVRGRLSRPILGIPGVRAGIKYIYMYIYTYILLVASESQPRLYWPYGQHDNRRWSHLRSMTESGTMDRDVFGDVHSAGGGHLG